MGHSARERLKDYYCVMPNDIAKHVVVVIVLMEK